MTCFLASESIPDIEMSGTIKSISDQNYIFVINSRKIVSGRLKGAFAVNLNLLMSLVKQNQEIYCDYDFYEYKSDWNETFSGSGFKLVSL